MNNRDKARLATMLAALATNVFITVEADNAQDRREGITGLVVSVLGLSAFAYRLTR